MKNYREIMRRSRFLLLILAIIVLLAGCTSKTPDDPTSPVSYTLTLNANGGALATGTSATQQIASGSRATQPADPTRANYTFAGWTTASNGADLFDFSRPITASLTLYAKWEAVASAYTVTFDANGGTLSGAATQQITSGGQATRPADPTWIGYTFLGWTLTKDGANFFNFGAELITAGLTLYAKWQDNSVPAATYAVTFDGNGGALATGTNATEQIASGSQATQPAAPARAMEGQWDFAFVYWSADKRMRFDFTTPVTQATTLYAMWSVAIPDTNFRNKLKTIVPSAFEGDRLVVSHADVTGLTFMDVGESSISDLSGIEFFTALTVLACFDNQLSVLDVRQNTALVFLSCGENRLASLDVSQNTALTTLGCNDNQLTMLDVSRNSALTALGCSDNQLTALDVSLNTALTQLNCDSNPITALDVRQNTVLTELSCYLNRLTVLDVRQNVALTVLDCSFNRLTVLDVRQNVTLTRLDSSFNQLTTLDVSQNTALTELYCSNNQLLTTLDIRGMRSVPSSSSTPPLDLSGNPNLATLKVHSNLKDNSIVYGVKTNRGNALTIEVSDAPAGSANYTKTCSSYQPGNGATGTCTTP